jgi:hypothetical protein
VKERQGILFTGVLGLLLLTWLGFLLHRSPRFAGSGWGAVFGIAGAVLMMVPLVYPLVKRIPYLRSRITHHVSLQSLMSLHAWAGIFGPLFAIIHTAHKFDSWLGIALTATMLLVVVSGFTVRYLLTYVSHDMTDKLVLLQTARGDLDSAWGVLENSPPAMRVLPKATLRNATLASLGIDTSYNEPAVSVIHIAESVADLEYSIRLHELLKVWFGRSLKLHIVVSIFFYALLLLHIGAGIYFGLRWIR